MKKHAEETHEIFAIDADRSVLVGESYLVATAYRTFGPYWFGEQYLLLERPTQHLDYAAVCLAASGIPKNIAVVDLKFMIDEVKILTRNYFASHLLKRFEETKNPEVLAVKFDFKPCEISALARCWIRNMYHYEIKEIARTTAVNELPPVLQSFFSLPVFAPK
jgi:hypothetical protein